VEDEDVEEAEDEDEAASEEEEEKEEEADAPGLSKETFIPLFTISSTSVCVSLISNR
jgi:hypothetical protein